MRRKIIFLLGLIICVAALAALVKFLGNRSPKQGELRVDSEPTASVFLDNKHIGRTPLKNKIDVGEYTIKLTPESVTPQLSSWEGKINIGANLLTYVNATLSDSELTTAVDLLWLEKITSKQSELSVVTNPDGATVLINNETKGVTPLTLSDMAEGDQTLTVTSPGFSSRTLKIKATPAYKLNASLKLALSAGVPAPEATASPVAGLSPTPGKPTPTKTATSAATIPDPPRPFVIIQDTPTGFLRVRMEPSTSATEAARVKPGEKYTIQDEKSGWYQIKYDGTNEGWISGQYAQKVE